MREELTKYLRLTEAMLGLDLEAEEPELPRLELLMDARDKLIPIILKLDLSPGEKAEFSSTLCSLDEALAAKLREVMADLEMDIDDLKKAKSSKARTRTALVNYEGKGEEINSVFFDKNT